MDKEEIIAELEEDLGKKIVEFFEGKVFRFKTEDGTKYEGCEDEAVAERIARARLEVYPESVLGLEGVALTYFDTDSFVNDCINGDGWQHTLCRYDGCNKETKNGVVYWRA